MVCEFGYRPKNKFWCNDIVWCHNNVMYAFAEYTVFERNSVSKREGKSE